MTYQNWIYRILIENNNYHTVTPVTGSVSILKNRQSNEIFGRFELDSITVYGDDVDFLEGLDSSNTDIEIYLNGVLQVVGIIDLIPDIDDNTKFYTYPLSLKDEYTNLVDGYETEINVINDTDIDRVGVKSFSQIQKLTYKQNSNFSDGIGSLFGVFSGGGGIDIYARQEITINTQSANVLIGKDGWTFVLDNGDGTYQIARAFSDTGLPSPAINTLESEYNTQTYTAGRYWDKTGASGLSINDTLTFNNGTTSENITFLFEQDAGGGIYAQNGVYDDRYYGDEIQYYTRFRDLFQTIEFIVGELDSSILFDKSGGENDSFYYFKTFQNGASQYTLKNLWISSISDMILDVDGFEQDTQTLCNLTFKKLTDFLKNRFRVFWELREDSGNYYIIFKHWTETQKTISKNPDLTNWYNINWSISKKQSTFDKAKIFKQIKRGNFASNSDFVGADIFILNISTNDVLILDNSVFFDDITDIYTNQSAYPNNSTNQFAIVTTDDIELRPEDALSSLVFANDIVGELYESFSYIGSTITAQNTIGTGSCRTDAKVSTGISGTDFYKIDYDLTVTSGITPLLFIGNKTYTLSPGTGQILITQPQTPERWYVKVSAASAFTLTFNSVNSAIYPIMISTGELSGLSLQNTAISIANTDTDHIANIPFSNVNVNGSDIVLSEAQLSNIKSVASINTPLSDFGRWFFSDLVNIDLGNAEIQGIAQNTDNKLAVIQLMFKEI